MEMANIAQSQENAVKALPAIAAALQKVTGADGTALHLAEDGGLGNDMGTAGAITPTLLKQDPLVADAITAQGLKYNADVARVSDADTKALYETAEVGAHGAIPVLFRGAVVAVISLQWRRSYEFTDTMRDFIDMAARQVALTLACL